MILCFTGGEGELELYEQRSAIPEHQKPSELVVSPGEELPTLARLARRFLAVSASGAPSERVWSRALAAGRPERARETASRIGRSTFINQNIHALHRLEESERVRVGRGAMAIGQELSLIHD